jgi:epoxide hydrolase
MTDADRAVVEAQRARVEEDGGYRMVQQTKPDSLTVARSDSPAGLAAWIVE